MVANSLKYIALFIGLVSVAVSVIYSNTETVFIKPVFHIFLFLFCYFETKKFNILLFFFLLFAAVGETFMAAGFEDNYVGVMSLFLGVFTTGILLLKPVLKTSRFKFQPGDIIIPIILMLIILYAIASLFLLAIDYIPDLIFYGITVFAFLCFIASCLYIPLANKHPNNIFVTITGFGYTFVVVGAIIYELVAPTGVLLALVNIVEVLTQLSFVIYITKRDEVLTQKVWYL